MLGTRNRFAKCCGQHKNASYAAEEVIDAIDRSERVLADKVKPKEERADALKFVVHFVGNVYQRFTSLIPTATSAAIAELCSPWIRNLRQ